MFLKFAVCLSAPSVDVEQQQPSATYTRCTVDPRPPSSSLATKTTGGVVMCRPQEGPQYGRTTDVTLTAPHCAGKESQGGSMLATWRSLIFKPSDQPPQSIAGSPTPSSLSSSSSSPDQGQGQGQQANLTSLVAGFWTSSRFSNRDLNMIAPVSS